MERARPPLQLPLEPPSMNDRSSLCRRGAPRCRSGCAPRPSGRRRISRSRSANARSSAALEALGPVTGCDRAKQRQFGSCGVSRRRAVTGLCQTRRAGSPFDSCFFLFASDRQSADSFNDHGEQVPRRCGAARNHAPKSCFPTVTRRASSVFLPGSRRNRTSAPTSMFSNGGSVTFSRLKYTSSPVGVSM